MRVHPTLLRGRHRPWLAFLAGCLAGSLAHSPPAAAQALPGESLPVREIRLENGMTVLALPRPGAPTVSFVVQYRAGSLNEAPGSTGSAHLLEHMLFKGTTSVGVRNPEGEAAILATVDAAHDSLLRARGEADPSEVTRLGERLRILEDSARTFVVPNEFEGILTRQGARGLNATTTNEATIYYVEMPANRLELWFVLEADRMAHPVFREFYTERDVVMEERRQRVDTNPAGLLLETHLEAAFTRHPYGVPVVGRLVDLETLSRADMASYHRRFYGPENAVAVLVGDLDPDRVQELAERYFGSLPRRGEPVTVPPPEPPQGLERRVELHLDAQPQVRMGWHTVDAFHPDMPALSMLTALLTGGLSSRLYRGLVLEDGVAVHVTASLGPGDRFPQLFQIDATPREPHTTRDVEEAVYAEIERLAREPPADMELQRVRNQLEAADVRRLQSNLGLAFQLAASAALFGDWRATFRQARRLREVTPRDVQSVVQRYFRVENRTVATLIPSPAGGGAVPGPEGGP